MTQQQTNTSDIQDIHTQQREDRVTKKEIFTRIVRLEVKMEEMWVDQRNTRRQFKTYVAWIMAFMVVDTLLSLILLAMQIRG